MDGPHVGWNVLRNSLFAFGKDLPQRPGVAVGAGFLEGAPFHSCEQRVASREQRASKTRYSPLATRYIPGSFMPAILRAKLGLPICLNIFFIWAYWRRRLLTSCTEVPEPRAMRLRRLPLMTS